MCESQQYIFKLLIVQDILCIIPSTCLIMPSPGLIDALADLDLEDHQRELFHKSLQGNGTDFILRAGEFYSHCHRRILKAESDFFRDNIDPNKKEFQFEDDSVMKEVGILTNVKMFLYLGEADVTTENAEQMLEAAAIIERIDLKAFCQKFLIESLSADTYEKCEALAKTYGLRELEEKCSEFANGEMEQQEYGANNEPPADQLNIQAPDGIGH